MNKALLLAELAALRSEWETLLAEAQPSGGATRVKDDWTLADLIYHVTWYEQEMVRLLIDMRLDGSPLWQLPHDERNQKIWAQGRQRPFATLLTLSNITHQALVAALAALPDYALHDATAFATMPPDWQPLDLIIQNTTSHYRQHLPALRASLAAERKKES